MTLSIFPMKKFVNGKKLTFFNLYVKQVQVLVRNWCKNLVQKLFFFGFRIPNLDWFWIIFTFLYNLLTQFWSFLDQNQNFFYCIFQPKFNDYFQFSIIFYRAFHLEPNNSNMLYFHFSFFFVLTGYIKNCLLNP